MVGRLSTATAREDSILAVRIESGRHSPSRGSLVETIVQYNTQSRTICRFQAFSTKTTMAKGYAKDQPQGFSNRIENVAVIGVRKGLKVQVLKSRVYL